MKGFLAFIQRTVIRGLFFLIPLLIFSYLIEKIWIPVKTFIEKFAASLHIEHFTGKTLLTILTIAGILLLCFLGGLLVQISMMGKFKSWLDNNILRYIPGYIFFQQIIGEQLHANNDTQVKLPVLLIADDTITPGIVTEFCKVQNTCVVFIPEIPTFNEGNIYIVDIHKVKLLPHTLLEFKTAIQQYGKGLSAININSLPGLK